MNKIKSNNKPSNISLIIPVYNEEQVLPILMNRLLSLIESFQEFKFEFILINDGSEDNSKLLIHDACQNCHFMGIHFSRNFGHQAAVTAGLLHATGDYIAVIDGDLQDPPELIPEMLFKMREVEADVVYGVRTHRKENFFKRSCYFLFYRFLAFVTPIEIPLDSGDFGIMTRRVVDAINSMPEHHRFVRGLRAYSGFKQIPLSLIHI